MPTARPRLAALVAAATHAALVLERATDAIAWHRSGASVGDAVDAATHAFPELTLADRIAIRHAVREASIEDAVESAPAVSP